MGGDTTTRPRRATWDVTTPDESIAMKLERLDAALAAADAEGVLTGFRAILYVPIFVGTFVLALPPGDQAALFVALLAAAVASGRKS